jgi:hypothetical protein
LSGRETAFWRPLELAVSRENDERVIGGFDADDEGEKFHVGHPSRGLLRSSPTGC